MLTNQSEGFIKVHLKNGGLYIFDYWKVNTSSDTLFGTGKYFDYKRSLVKTIPKSSFLPSLKSNCFSVARPEIALIETNSLKSDLGNLTAISIVGVPTALVSAYCLTNPKACFGSCPTFYALKNGQWSLMSEGFSSSISPSFEKTDIDMLYWADEPQNNFSLKLTNEALETHVIRYVDVLAFPDVAKEKVFATEQGQFFRTSGIKPPISCQADEGDCLNKVKEMDHIERFSQAGAKNLSEKEEVFVSFENSAHSELGFLIGSKQTFLTTHLFYQVMALTGNYYGELVAEAGNGNSILNTKIQRLWDQLGGIEIFIQEKNNRWNKIGEISEMGPIASDVHLVKLPRVNQDKITLKLRMTKGLWRIDYLAAAEIVGEETPLRIKPDLVLQNDSANAEALNCLNERTNPLTTYPGDIYELKYKLPGDCTYQFFLETKGYYLEWMRENWLQEENLKKAAFALYFPKLFLKKAAPEFKKAEPMMEKLFWESRYVKQ